MAEAPQGIVEQLRSIWNRLSNPQRISLGVLSGGVFIGLILLVVFMNGQEYQTLYSGLNAEDAGGVMAKLKERKIPYQVADGGTVKVPAEKINEIRIQMASEGLPQSGRIGFEIFDKTNFGITDFTAQVNYRRALEGELERTIRSLEEVSQARVHLTLPKESLFAQQAEPAKASVFLRLKAGRQLAPGSAHGITHLVSSAVEGLRPENVAILDTHAKVLSAGPGGDGMTGLTQPEMAIQRQAEKELADKVVSILEPVVGHGKVRANTSLQMDFSSGELTEELYTPANNPVVSQQKSEERLTTGAGLSGIPGTRSNQPATAAPGTPAAPAAPTSAPDTRVKQNEITNFEVSRTVRHTMIPKGSIKKLSVAVVVDDKLAPQKTKDNKGGKETVAMQPASRTADEMKNLRALVEGAVGYNKDRGDMLTIENIAFESALLPEADAPTTFIAKHPEYVKMAIRYGAILLLLLLAHFILLRPIMRHVLASAPTPAPAEASALLPAGLAPRLAGPDVAAMAAAAAAPPGDLDKLMGTASSEAPPSLESLEASIEAEFGQGPRTESVRMSVLKKKVIEIAQKDPHTTANLIRGWLEEGEPKR